MSKAKFIKILATLVVVLAMIFAVPAMSLGDQGTEYSPQGSGNVVIIIQSGDPEVVFFGLLFADRAIKNQWMDNVKVVLWGPAEKRLQVLRLTANR